MKNAKKNLIAFTVIFFILSLPFSSISESWTNEEFSSYLISQHGNTLDFKKKLEANYNTYRVYDHQIVYGSPFGDSAYSTQTGRTEFRYLGYAYDSITKVTNTYFPADAGGGGTPLTWTYLNPEGSSDTWDKNTDASQRAHMLTSPLSYSGTPYPISVTSIGGTSKARLLTPATWKSGFSVFTQHKWGGSLRYATLVGPQMGVPTLNCTLATPLSTYTIRAGENSVTIPVTVSASAALTGTYVKPAQISAIAAAFPAALTPASPTSAAALTPASLTPASPTSAAAPESPAFPSAGTYTSKPGEAAVTHSAQKLITRSDFSGPGTYTVSLQGLATLTSIYNDSITAQCSETVSITIEDDQAAGISITAAVTPEKKLTDGTSNETVSISASATVNSYSNPGNISSWRWYAKLDGEETTLKSLSKPGGSMQSEATFSFTIDKAKLATENFIQKIKVTAQANFESNVGGKSNVSASRFVTSQFYRQSAAQTVDPPLPPPGQPVARINAPNIVFAGESVYISGTSSHSPNGAITAYSWDLPGTSSPISGSGGYTSYLSQGSYNISLTITDSAGIQNSTAQTITVLPPTPTAVIRVSGSLKENRKITLDATQSIGQTSYPINHSRTTWSVAPTTSTTTATAANPSTAASSESVKYSGSLIGEIKKDILIKAAGTYTLTLSVTNTAGYSHTASRELAITEDLAPEAAFYAPASILRDPAQSSIAAIDLTDQSSSPDNDNLAARSWSYQYDSDNDGSFDDEVSIESRPSTESQTVTPSASIPGSSPTSGTTFTPSAPTSPSVVSPTSTPGALTTEPSNPDGLSALLKTSQVGRYKITETVKEDFLHNTLPEFVLPENYKSSTISQIVEVPNSAPTAAFSLLKAKLADISIITDYTGAKLAELNEKLAQLKAYLFTKNVDLSVTINYGASTVEIGRIPKPGRPANMAQTSYSSSYQSYDYPRLYVANTGKTSTGEGSPSNIVSVHSNGSFHTAIDASGNLYGWGNPVDPILAPFPIPADGSSKTTLTNYNGTYTQAYGSVYSKSGQVFKDALCLGNCVITLETSGILRLHGMNCYHNVAYLYGTGGAQLMYYGGDAIAENVRQIEGGGYSSIFLKNDGTVWGVGSTVYDTAGSPGGSFAGYQTYNGYLVNYWYVCSTPQQISGLQNITRLIWTETTVNNEQLPTAFAVDSQNRVWTWGYVLPDSGAAANDFAHIHSPDTSNKVCTYTPQVIPNLDGRDIKDIAYGSVPKQTVGSNIVYSTPALRVLKNDGTVWVYKNGLLTPLTQEMHTVAVNGSIAPKAYELSNIIAMGDSWYLRNDGLFLSCISHPQFVRYLSEANYPTADWQQKVYAPDLQSFSTAALRPGSQRFLLWVSDSEGSSYSDGYGSYFPLGNLTSDFVARVASAGYKTGAVCPEATYDYHSGMPGQTATIRNLAGAAPLTSTTSTGSNSTSTGSSSVTDTPGTSTGAPPSGLYASDQLSVALADISALYEATSDNVVENYVIAGEDKIDYRTFYSDYENDPMYASKWVYTHDCSFFENNTGQAAFSGQALTAPEDMLYKPGKYKVEYFVQDNPKDSDSFNNYKLWSEQPASMTVYAHRRPLALFEVSFTGLDSSGNYLTSVSEHSYDPDHSSLVTKGIATRAWQWKAIDDESWTSGALPALLALGKTYLIQLIVTDLEGAQSYPKVLSIETTGTDFPPTVDCTPTSRDWSNTSVTCTVAASDPNSDFARTDYCWSASSDKPSTGWTSSTQVGFQTTMSLEGVRYLHMQTFDLAGNSFYRVRGPYNIDRTTPTVTCSPTSGSSTSGAINVQIFASDSGGSGLRRVNYKFTTSAVPPTSGWLSTEVNGPTTLRIDTSVSQPGNWYLHMRAVDRAGNNAYNYRGLFRVTTLAITGVSVSGAWNHWRGQVDLFGDTLTNEPHRFLSLEKVKITVNTTGSPDSLEISLSPELQSMIFTDSRGNIYSYKDQTGYIVEFPKTATSPGNTYTWDYILPLAPSTKGWDNAALRAPYWLRVNAYKGGYTTTYTVSDINLTGNVYDLTYIQPK